MSKIMHITAVQIRLHLNTLGIRQAFEDTMLQDSQNTHDIWNYSPGFEFNDDLITRCLVTLGFSQDKIDKFFIEASAL